MILIVYNFANIDTYVGDDPPQQDDEMDDVVEQPIAHGLVMPQRSDLRFWTKLVDCICYLFTIKGLRLIDVRDIT